MMNYLISAIIALTLSVGGWFGLQEAKHNNLFGAFSDPFISLQLATDPDNLEILQTDGTDNSWITCATLTGSADLCDGTDDTGSGDPFAWTPTSYGVSTSTTLGFLNGFLSTASSTIDSNLIITGNSTTTNATTTSFAISSLSSALLKVDGNGSVIEAVAGTDYLSDITGESIEDLSDVASFTQSAGDFFFYNGSAWDAIASSTLSFATSTLLADDNTWSGTNVFSTALADASVADTLTIDGSSSVTWEALTSYPTGCTNQFVRTIGDTLTCATVGAADVSLANLTATDASLTFSGTYTGATARTIGVNLAHDFTWTGFHNFGGATSLEIPNGTAPTVNLAGELALDTTSNNLILATSTSHFVVASASTTLYALSIASTSPDFASGGVIELPPHPLAQTVMSVGCAVDGGTNKVVVISDDGTNDMTSVTCTTTWQWFTISTNNNLTANERARLEIGASSGTPDYVILRIMGYRRTD